MSPGGKRKRSRITNRTRKFGDSEDQADGIEKGERLRLGGCARANCLLVYSGRPPHWRLADLNVGAWSPISKHD